MRWKLFILSSLSLATFNSCKKCQSCNTLIEDQSNQTISSTTNDYCGDNYDDAPTETSYSETVAGETQSVTISCVEQ